MKKINLSLILITLMIAAFLIGYGKMNSDGSSFLSFGNKKAEQTVQKAIDFISENILGGTRAVLVSVLEESGVYKFKMKVNEQEFESYLTKDGKILFPDGINLVQKETAEAKKMTCNDINKTGKPVLEAFVVSQCPFGLQMQRVLNEIIKNVPQISPYIKVEYMGSIENGKITSMHGDEEAQENLRQICLREEQPSNFWAYIGCYIKEGKVDTCLETAQIDVSKLTGCLSDGSRGLAYAEKDFANQNKYEVTGSPTLILDGAKVSEFDFGGRTAEAVKTMVCCGFQDQPDFCSQKLNNQAAETGFSPTYSSNNNSNNNSSCD